MDAPYQKVSSRVDATNSPFEPHRAGLGVDRRTIRPTSSVQPAGHAPKRSKLPPRRHGNSEMRAERAMPQGYRPSRRQRNETSSSCVSWDESSRSSAKARALTPTATSSLPQPNAPAPSERGRRLQTGTTGTRPTTVSGDSERPRPCPRHRLRKPPCDRKSHLGAETTTRIGPYARRPHDHARPNAVPAVEVGATKQPPLHRLPTPPHERC